MPAQCPRDRGAELKEAAAEGARMRHAQVWPELCEQLDEARVVGKNTDWPGFDLGKDALIEVLDGVRHGSHVSVYANSGQHRKVWTRFQDRPAASISPPNSNSTDSANSGEVYAAAPENWLFSDR